jgi:phospholipase/carboxylesterase
MVPITAHPLAMRRKIEDDGVSLTARSGILTARPRQFDRTAPGDREATAPPAPGLRRLELDGARDGLLYIPHGYRSDQPSPLIVMLHGAGAAASDVVPLLTRLPDEDRFILLAPDSRGPTWDVILGDYGPDVAFIDMALERVFARLRVDPARIALAGFSDGASYALSLGLMNGDLFTHIIAFSPCFMSPLQQRGRPHVFVSHGAEDPVLPIGHCSRRLVPRLQAAGYSVCYREFPDGHIVPLEIAQEAIEWWFTGVCDRP